MEFGGEYAYWGDSGTSESEYWGDTPRADSTWRISMRTGEISKYADVRPAMRSVSSIHPREDGVYIIAHTKDEPARLWRFPLEGGPGEIVFERRRGIIWLIADRTLGDAMPVVEGRRTLQVWLASPDGSKAQSIGRLPDSDLWYVSVVDQEVYVGARVQNRPALMRMHRGRAVPVLEDWSWWSIDAVNGKTIHGSACRMSDVDSQESCPCMKVELPDGTPEPSDGCPQPAYYQEKYDRILSRTKAPPPARAPDPLPALSDLDEPVLPSELQGSEWWCAIREAPRYGERSSLCYRTLDECRDSLVERAVLATNSGWGDVSNDVCRRQSEAACLVFPGHEKGVRVVGCFSAMDECSQMLTFSLDHSATGPYPSRCGLFGQSE